MEKQVHSVRQLTTVVVACFQPLASGTNDLFKRREQYSTTAYLAIPSRFPMRETGWSSSH